MCLWVFGKYVGQQGSSDMLLANFTLQCSCLPCASANLACPLGPLSGVVGHSAQALIPRMPWGPNSAHPAHVRIFCLCSVLTSLLALQVSPTLCPPR